MISLFNIYNNTHNFGNSALDFIKLAYIANGTSFVKSIAILVLAITSKLSSVFCSLFKILFIVYIATGLFEAITSANLNISLSNSV